MQSANVMKQILNNQRMKAGWCRYISSDVNNVSAPKIFAVIVLKGSQIAQKVQTKKTSSAVKKNQQIERVCCSSILSPPPDPPPPHTPPSCAIGNSSLDKCVMVNRTISQPLSKQTTDEKKS